MSCSWTSAAMMLARWDFALVILTAVSGTHHIYTSDNKLMSLFCLGGQEHVVPVGPRLH